MTLEGLIQRYRRWRLGRLGLKLDRSCQLGAMISLGSPSTRASRGSIRIGQSCELGQGVELNPWNGHITIGERVFIGPYAVLYGQGGIEIGNDTLIAMHCCILSSNHTIPGVEANIRDHPDVLLPTRIGRDVWLGAGTCVLGGVTIGDGCVVGAGSVVTHDIPSYTIAKGVPARITGHRQKPEHGP